MIEVRLRAPTTAPSRRRSRACAPRARRARSATGRRRSGARSSISAPHFRYDEKSTPEQITMLDQDRRRQARTARASTGTWLVRERGDVRRAGRPAAGHPLGEASSGATGRTTEYFRHGEARRRRRSRQAEAAHDGLHRLPQPARAPVRDAGHRRGPRARRRRHLADAAVREVAVGRLALEGLPDARGGARRPRRTTCSDFYAQKYPDISAARGVDIDKLVDGLIGHLRPQRVPRDEGELEDVPVQHRPPQLGRAASAATTASTSRPTARCSSPSARRATPSRSAARSPAWASR